ncbi:MAG: hypothetical protein APG08_00074 [Candidatus Methanofastidiosum methylothiophilum]|jgi:hypothetical protein|uniref:DegT/DnrJ/EryC1/StrS aminotransferase family protein n=1 Tax=Candidatus Methanofastidiosum methylothiophilum TaxID=1705564 RepID=A0A150JK45_9EURY|nr:MAG: hypothetical protein AN188_00111 [Candidatus Methanofastidiosum methylthiophilus]MBP6932402.1 hypothetical protein [Methanofastidiosum sp.]OQC52276.1 MAG: hypothetical protein BWX56_00411 [Euryarchaeota archaeon ADurb.Bin023]KYC57605.1 MAG: hypothetical protein APG08_00074 [Candidatus Methanofastidiosum methylthiophilus]KYC58506.1 MAG: hypothetical protein APG09_00253 [Candidatus Methanofastidiosum methylthiophilus]
MEEIIPTLRKNISQFLNRDYKLFFVNSATFGLFSILFDSSINKIGIPDQGGFKGFIEMPNLLKKEYIEIPTDKGIIVPKFKKDFDVFLFTSLSGYISSNPSKLICQETKKIGIVSIEDISGTFPDKDFGWADIIYCSTGSPKILECGYGGFVGISTEINLKESEKVLSFSHLPKSYYEKLYTELENSNKKLNKLRDIAQIFYKSSLDIPYKDPKSLSIFVKHVAPNKSLERLNREIRPKMGKSLFTKCPRYDRIKESGFVIESIKLYGMGTEEIKEISEKIEELI